MTDLEKQIAEALEGVTEGPWLNIEPDATRPSRAGVCSHNGAMIYDAPLTEETSSNARFIAAARSLLPAALSKLRSLRQWRDAISGCIKTAPEFAAGSWGGDKEGWGYHLEVVAEVLRSRRSLGERAANIELGYERALASLRERAEAAERDVQTLREESMGLRDRIVELFGRAVAAEQRAEAAERWRNEVVKAWNEGATLEEIGTIVNRLALAEADALVALGDSKEGQPK